MLTVKCFLSVIQVFSNLYKFSLSTIFVDHSQDQKRLTIWMCVQLLTVTILSFRNPKTFFRTGPELVRPQVLPAALSTLAKWCKVLESVSCVDVSLSLFHTCSLVLSFLLFLTSFFLFFRLSLSLSGYESLSFTRVLSLSLSLSLSQAVSKIKQR